MQFGASIWPFQWTPPYDAGIKRLASLGFKLASSERTALRPALELLLHCRRRGGAPAGDRAGTC